MVQPVVMNLFKCSLLVIFAICATPLFSQKFISFRDKHISYEGRIAFTKDAAALHWPGTSVRINFKGTQISGRFKDADTANYYNILIDNKIVSKLHFDTIQKTYLLASGLSNGKHSLQVFKRTEWDKGKTWFYGFEVAAKTQLLNPPKPPKRKIEFFGNSITCGYAIEDSVNDSPVGYFENCYDAYAAITARHFNAQMHATAKSGIGITISWAPLIMPEMYERLEPLDPNSKWDFSKFIPDLVVINLFQNDAWLTTMPGHEQFKARFGTKPPTQEFLINAYKSFVVKVRRKYPRASIICMLGNMDITRSGSPWPGYVDKAVASLHDKKIFTYFAPCKNTPGHPKTAEQQLLADGLIKFIKQHIRW